MLLTPTAIYSPVLRDLGKAGGVHAAAHITGGGFPDNVGRAVPDDLAAHMDLASWQPNPVFAWLHGLGVGARRAAAHLQLRPRHGARGGRRAHRRGPGLIADAGLEAHVVGEVVAREGGDAVRYSGELLL